MPHDVLLLAILQARAAGDDAAADELERLSGDTDTLQRVLSSLHMS